MFDKKCGDNPMRSFRLRVLSFSAVAALALSPALWPASAAETDASQAASAQAGAKEAKEAPLVTGSIGPVRTRFLALGVGKSVVVDLPREAKDVLVADPKIANAVIRSSQRAYIIGAAVGQTNVVFFDADGNQITSYDIAIKRDLNGIRAAMRSLPGVQIEGVSSSSFFASFNELSQLADLWMALFKAACFGFLAGMVACYKGLYAKGGPKGVGDAVNQAVVITFVLLFFVNFVLTVLYFNFVPQKI